MRIPETDWIWRGMAGHFCAANHCHFQLHTTVGHVRVSTVGAMYIAHVPGINPNEMQTVGCGRHYECAVYGNDENGEMNPDEQLDMSSLNVNDFTTPYIADEEAERIHLRMCNKWADPELVAMELALLKVPSYA